MLDKNWLNEFKDLIVQDYSDRILDCKKGIRAISIEISTFLDSTVDTNIFFKEKGICLAKFWIDTIDLEVTKKLFELWLIQKVSINELKQINETVTILEIYEYYLKGESSMIEYTWADIRQRIKENHLQFSEKKVELLDLCVSSVILKNYIPFISLGRLCLSNTTIYQIHYNKWLCLNFIEEYYEVATYNHEDVHLFETAKEAIEYCENCCAKNL